MIRHTLLALLCAALCAGCGNRENQPEYRLTYSVFFPPSHVQAKLAEAWARDVEAATANRVKITVYTGASLTKASQCYLGVVSGISDIGMSCFAYTPGRFPLLAGLDLPLGWPDGATATRVANEIALRHNPKEVRDTHLLYVHAHGPGVLASRAPVETLADVARLKTRATGLSSQMIKALGGTPVSMSQPETYDALSKGVVDATLCPVETLKGWRQGECIRTVTQAPALSYTTAMFVAMNKDMWNRLPADIQRAFTAVSARYVPLHGQGWNAADAAADEFLEQLGRRRITLTPEENARWEERLSGLFGSYLKRAADRGIDARPFLDDVRNSLKQETAP